MNAPPDPEMRSPAIRQDDRAKSQGHSNTEYAAVHPAGQVWNRTLTRAQRRLLRKLAERVDRETQADQRFFERFPHRRHRVRLASIAEIEQHELLEGEPICEPPGTEIFIAVRNIAPGCRLRLYVIGPEGAETDLDEETAKAIFESAASPHIWRIEAQMRKAMEARE